MSSNSYSQTCPKCEGENLEVCSNSRPYESVAGQCLDCGFTYWTEEGQMEIKEVNEYRNDYDLKPLKKLKKQEG